MTTNNNNTPSTSLATGSSLAESEYDTIPSSTSLQNSFSLNTTTTNTKNSTPNPQTLRHHLSTHLLPLHSNPLPPSPFSTPSTPHHSPLIYTDHTASHRPFHPIEHYLHHHCLPHYANTHTNTSHTGAQSTAFVAEARQIIAEVTGARITGKASSDVVLFAGSGCTAAVRLLIDGLLGGGGGRNGKKMLMITGPWEHHSNLVPWREMGCDMVRIPEDPSTGDVNLFILEKVLQNPKWEGYDLKMATFSICSNVTGRICTSKPTICRLLRQYRTLSFWDYATGASYLPLGKRCMNDDVDACFFSSHKILGGINAPGVLVCKKRLLSRTTVPGTCGGGTVFYVTERHHRFLSSVVERYEGGTPDVVGIWRSGLTFLTKRMVGDTLREDLVVRRTCEEFWGELPNVIVMGGDNKGQSVPVFSFLIKVQKRFLHYNFVCALLNDLFGIQSRGGCMCAGPYSQRLMGLSHTDNLRIEQILLRKTEVLRPGYTRISLPWKGTTEEEVGYVLRAIKFVGEYGWAFLPLYRCNSKTGEWRHYARQGKPLGKERRWLSHFNIWKEEEGEVSKVPRDEEGRSRHFEEMLLQAKDLLDMAKNDKTNIMQALRMSDASSSGISSSENDDYYEELRWFVTPKECANWIREGRDVIEVEEGFLGVIKPGVVSEEEEEGEGWDESCCYENEREDYPEGGEGDEEEEATLGVGDGGTTVDDEMVSPKPEVSCMNASCAVASSKDEPKQDTNNKETEETNDSPIIDEEKKSYYFKDGEHHEGEATIDDIQMGFDEGELSESCLIYDPEYNNDDKENDWIAIDTFLAKRTTASNGNSNQTTEDNNTADTTSLDTTSLPPDSMTKIPTNDSKKPSRTASQWGKSTTTTLPLPPPSTSTPQPSPTIQHGPITPPPKMIRLINQAIIHHSMIQHGDTLLLGLSGGKDSLSLLHCLLHLQRKLPQKFSIHVCTIDPMTPSFDPSPLIPYVESLGLPYHYVKDDIVERAATSGTDGKAVKSLCAFCARMKRGLLYATARKHKCNKLVLAQHLDDCAESFVMSLFHNGFLRTMKAKYEINAGDLMVIRPMVYCRESLMTDFAKSAGLPVINENCPACFEEPKERARIKKMLRREEGMWTNLYDNIRRGVLPLMHEDMTGIVRVYTEEILEKGRKKRCELNSGTKKKGKKNKKGGKRQQSGMNDGKIEENGETADHTMTKQTERKDDEQKIINNNDDEANNVTTTNESCSNEEKKDVDEKTVTTTTTTNPLLLHDFSDDELIAELARRRAAKFKTFGASPQNKRLIDDDKKEVGNNNKGGGGDVTNGDNDVEDPTGQICSLTGGGMAIPCYELME